MQFDDRLSTVLRHRAAGENAARVQFRQLLDLLGSWQSGPNDKILPAAWLRLGALSEVIPSPERVKMICETGERFRNPELVYHLSEDEPAVAAAALNNAVLTPEEWDALVPRLPVRARGFLRLRRDLAPSTLAVLETLGIHDRALPLPTAPEGLTQGAPLATAPIMAAAPIADSKIQSDAVRSDNGMAAADMPSNDPSPADPVAGDMTQADLDIAALVARIESFTRGRPRARKPDVESPHLPLAELQAESENKISGFAFKANSEGRIIWAERSAAPMVIGARLDGEAIRRSILLRQPIHASAMEMSGAADIRGSWIIDARPQFLHTGGQFSGYIGMFRRPPALINKPAAPTASQEIDRLRQVLHELRTPAGAIQGFAEIIQQQVFGPAPHEYRALAATIASDGARILAGFEEIDRLARLEAGALVITEGVSDFSAIVTRLVEQLRPSLSGRAANFDYAPELVGSITMPKEECEAMIWRILATMASTISAGEKLNLKLIRLDDSACLDCDLPASLAGERDIFTASSRSSNAALSAGMFGAGVSLRLARAEARAIGGDLIRKGDVLKLVLPLLSGGFGQLDKQSVA